MLTKNELRRGIQRYVRNGQSSPNGRDAYGISKYDLLDLGLDGLTSVCLERAHEISEFPDKVLQESLALSGDPLKSGKSRDLLIPRHLDAILAKTLLIRLEPWIVDGSPDIHHVWAPKRMLQKYKHLTENGQGHVYRPNPHLGRIAELCKRYPYAAHVDGRKYFPSLDRLLVSRLMEIHLPPEEVRLAMALTATPAGHGLSQGCPLSPALGAMALNDMDWMLTQRGKAFVRVGDDILVFANTSGELDGLCTSISTAFERLGVGIHPPLQYICEYGLPFAGYFLKPDIVQLSEAKAEAFLADICALELTTDELVYEKLRASLIRYLSAVRHGRLHKRIDRQIKQLRQGVHSFRALKQLAHNLSPKPLYDQVSGVPKSEGNSSASSPQRAESASASLGPSFSGLILGGGQHLKVSDVTCEGSPPMRPDSETMSAESDGAGGGDEAPSPEHAPEVIIRHPDVAVFERRWRSERQVYTSILVDLGAQLVPRKALRSMFAWLGSSMKAGGWLTVSIDNSELLLDLLALEQRALQLEDLTVVDTRVEVLFSHV